MWLMVSVHDFLALSLLDHNKENMAVVKKLPACSRQREEKKQEGSRVK